MEDFIFNAKRNGNEITYYYYIKYLFILLYFHDIFYYYHNSNYNIFFVTNG
jgi:hypothetical protein